MISRSYIEVFCKRSELAITDNELKLIAAAAIIGLNRMPKKGQRTPAAIRRLRGFIKKALRIFSKLLEAMQAAEVIRLAFVLKRHCRRFRIDGHTANGIGLGFPFSIQRLIQQGLVTRAFFGNDQHKK